mmetsp:Transcript_24698/g.38435  ORF Transcript_24698/g.38435 Transcript_24698/m.38435 type:complete len:131 (+) Transcript_24698:907-1299(+)
MVVLLPLFPILNYTGIEPFEWPDKEALQSLTLNALIGTVISDYCWAQSAVLMGPLITTLGITLTIPISMLTDKIFEEVNFTWQYYLGSVCIISSFFIIACADHREQERARRQKKASEYLPNASSDDESKQ